MKNEPAAALVDSSVRLAMRQTVHRSLPQVSIIAYNEIPTDPDTNRDAENPGIRELAEITAGIIDTERTAPSTIIKIPGNQC